MTFQRKKPRKDPMPWRVGILDHHEHKPTKADRGEFPAAVVKRLKQEANGRCQACRQRPDTQTHHVWPRGRSGRGVYTNGMRVCDICHDRIQTDETELQYWIAEYERRYGPRSWMDEQDLDEYKRSAEKAVSDEMRRRDRLNELAPVVDIITTCTGRRLKQSELAFLGRILPDQQHVEKLAGILTDAVKRIKDGALGYGERFED